MAQRIGIITQARMTSTRLPGKVLLELGGKSVLRWHVERLRRTGCPVIVATTTNSSDDPVAGWCEDAGVPVFRGSEEDVLERFYRAAREHSLDGVVRVTSDCPLIDPGVTGDVLARYLELDHDRAYVSNTLLRTFPRGLDTEVFSFRLLEEACVRARRPEEREHVTPYLYNGSGEKIYRETIVDRRNRSGWRLTLDTESDLALIRELIETHGAGEKDLGAIAAILREAPDLAAINAGVPQKGPLPGALPDLLLRGDGGGPTGFGHLSRLSALAEMAAADFRPVLVTRRGAPGLDAFLVRHAAAVVVPVPEGVPPEAEARWLSAELAAPGARVVLDGYAFDGAYQSTLRRAGLKVAVIDDLAEGAFDCDLLVHPAAGGGTEGYVLEGEAADVRVGTDYCLLRSPFLELAARAERPRRGGARELFLCFGGSDPGDLTSRYLALLAASFFEGVHVVLGPGYSGSAVGDAGRVELHRSLDVDGMVALMERCSHAVVPASTVAWEYCCAGGVLLTGHYVENQEASARSIGEAGLGYNMGDLRKVSRAELLDVVARAGEGREMVRRQREAFHGQQPGRYREALRAL